MTRAGGDVVFACITSMARIHFPASVRATMPDYGECRSWVVACNTRSCDANGVDDPAFSPSEIKIRRMRRARGVAILRMLGKHGLALSDAAIDGTRAGLVGPSWRHAAASMPGRRIRTIAWDPSPNRNQGADHGRRDHQTCA